MGILNVTADSFYDGGKYLSEERLICRIHEIVEQGAGIIDVGACSTRPGAELVGEQEELSRLAFAIELVRKYYPALPVSVDTFRAAVAREICRCLGPVIVNDISGGELDPEMFDTVAELKLPYILTHMQGTPRDMQCDPRYGDVVGEVSEYLLQGARRLEAMGVAQPILDPGFGFGKNAAHNYALLEATDHFAAMGYPLLVGISRKTMIWKTLGVTPKEALNGTTVLNTVALMKGASLLRVHDVREAVEAVKLVGMISGEPVAPLANY